MFFFPPSAPNPPPQHLQSQSSLALFAIEAGSIEAFPLFLSALSNIDKYNKPFSLFSYSGASDGFLIRHAFCESVFLKLLNLIERKPAPASYSFAAPFWPFLDIMLGHFFSLCDLLEDGSRPLASACPPHFEGVFQAIASQSFNPRLDHERSGGNYFFGCGPSHASLLSSIFLARFFPSNRLALRSWNAADFSSFLRSAGHFFLSGDIALLLAILTHLNAPPTLLLSFGAQLDRLSLGDHFSGTRYAPRVSRVVSQKPAFGFSIFAEAQKFDLCYLSFKSFSRLIAFTTSSSQVFEVDASFYSALARHTVSLLNLIPEPIFSSLHFSVERMLSTLPLNSETQSIKDLFSLCATLPPVIHSVNPSYSRL